MRLLSLELKDISAAGCPLPVSAKIQHLLVKRQKTGTMSYAYISRADLLEFIVKIGLIRFVEGACGFIEQRVAGFGQ